MEMLVMAEIRRSVRSPTGRVFLRMEQASLPHSENIDAIILKNLRFFNYDL